MERLAKIYLNFMHIVFFGFTEYNILINCQYNLNKKIYGIASSYQFNWKLDSIGIKKIL